MKPVHLLSEIRLRGLVLAAAGVALLPVMPTTLTARADDTPRAAVTGTYFGTELWFDTMRNSPASSHMLLELAKTNIVNNLPSDCVEAAGTVTFPDGNPFPDNPPELNIYCRNQAADSVARAPGLDQSCHFYTILKRGQTYDFYWKLSAGRERFCSIQVQPGAQPRQKLEIPFRLPKPPSTDTPADRISDPRDRVTILREYDLSGFPAMPGSEETKKIDEAMRSARTTTARANAHEMLARYYREVRSDNTRAQAEFKKAQDLRTPPSP